MNLAFALTRSLFFLLSLFFVTVYMVTGPGGYSATSLITGLVLGTCLAFALIGFELLFRRFNLRAWNIAIIGLFVGYLMGQALNLILSGILTISAASFQLTPQAAELLQIALFLFGIYLGTLITIRSSDEFYISIPFIRLSEIEQKKKDLLLDSSVLNDSRILDLAASGLIDSQLVVPKFLVKDLHLQAELQEEEERQKGKKGLEILKKLEAISELNLRYSDTDFPEMKDIGEKMVRLARFLHANIITSDVSRAEAASHHGIRFIHLQALSNALKPLTQAGEHIKIKIQRYGKEPNQGVGYLEDGSMVVVNGGGDFLGQTIDTVVLSVKHTSSGRMIFCNATEDGKPRPNEEEPH